MVQIHDEIDWSGFCTVRAGERQSFPPALHRHWHNTGYTKRDLCQRLYSLLTYFFFSIFIAYFRGKRVSIRLNFGRFGKVCGRL